MGKLKARHTELRTSVRVADIVNEFILAIDIMAGINIACIKLNTVSQKRRVESSSLKFNYRLKFNFIKFQINLKTSVQQLQTALLCLEEEIFVKGKISS